MTLRLYITSQCCACSRVQSDLEKITENMKNVHIIISDIAKQQNPRVAIVPALFVDEELYAYGDFDLNKFKIVLNK